MTETSEIRHIALGDIDPDAFPRDRADQSDDATDALYNSILTHGLRQPIELCAQDGGRPYALISGYCRLKAVRRLHEFCLPQFAAFLRDPKDSQRALVA